MFLPLKDENQTKRFPVVTVLFIALNAAIFFYQAFSVHGLEYHLLKMGTVPYEITHFTSIPLAQGVPRSPLLLTLFASMFIHGGLFHLLGNMLYLWIFGNNVEDVLGSVRFVLFYLISGLGAAMTHIAFQPNSRLPMIGASGAIAGVLGAYFILFPGAKVTTLVFLIVYIRVIALPAAYVLGFWFLMQILNVGLGGGVAWFAHIGGFLIGLAMIKSVFRKRVAELWGR